jgi:hypothetical protein
MADEITGMKIIQLIMKTNMKLQTARSPLHHLRQSLTPWLSATEEPQAHPHVHTEDARKYERPRIP